MSDPTMLMMDDDACRVAQHTEHVGNGGFQSLGELRAVYKLVDGGFVVLSPLAYGLGDALNVGCPLDVVGG